MSLDVETRTIATLAKVSSLEVEYSACLEDSTIFSMMASVKSGVNSIKSAAVDSITDKMNNMISGDAMYGLQCAAQALPAIGDAMNAFDQSMDGLAAIAKGDYFSGIDSNIDLIILGLSCPNFLTALTTLNNLCDSVLSNLNSLISEYVSLETLQGLVVSSLGTIGALLGCGLNMYGGLDGLDSSITDLNSTLKNGLSSVSEAKAEGTTILDVNRIAKEKVVEKLNLDGQMTSVKNNFVSKIAILG